MRRLILLRHGESTWNAEGRIQGQADAPLSDRGLAQAEAVAPRIAAEHPVALWCSDLSRARVTAEAVGRASGLAPRLDPRLREFSLGEAEGMLRDDFAQAHPEAFAGFASGDFDAVAGGESTQDVAGRVGPAVDALFGNLAAGETGVAVFHGGAIRVALAVALGWTPSMSGTLGKLGNCAWATLAEAGDGHLVLADFNSSA